MPPDFPVALERLVALARATKGFPGQKPEEATKHLFLRPLLAALGYADSDITPEFHIFQDDCDYLLRSDGEPLLFVEAKSYFDRGRGGNLYEAHREQVRRYLRNYRLHPDILAKAARPVAWLLLTNFAQLHLVRVNEDAPTFSFKLDELLSRAAELWELLARERLAVGRIDELYDQELKAGLDARFLADLKRWRLLLANGYGIRNQTASLDDLTSASQQLLDRFLFCRMLETHGLIEHNKLARAFVRYEEIFSFDNAPTFAEFLRTALFREIETNFNTELFKQPQLCDTLAIDNTFLAALTGHSPPGPELASLGGGPASAKPRNGNGQGELFAFRHLYSYDFSRMSQDIMGAVYERFLAHRLLEKITPGLGRVIVIEETDELRKKEGIYYTPTYIVDYLVEHTLGAKTAPIVERAIALVEEEKFTDARAAIDALRALRVLDPSMGSGSFLLRAFDHLLAAYGRYNAAARASKAAAHARVAEAPDPLFGGSSAAGVAEEIPHPAQRIATDNLFGVDLDAQAVELARLNLWMRLLVAERDRLREALARPAATGRPRNLLPAFADNLKRGNSLIADPAVAGDAAFDWNVEFPEIMANGGFDVVVGNPPYRMLQPHNTDLQTLDSLRKSYAAVEFKIDLFHLFLQRAESLLKTTGELGYIVPTTLLNNVYAERLRAWLMQHFNIRYIAVALERVFADADVYTTAFVFRRGQTSDHEVLSTTAMGENFTERPDLYSRTKQSRFAEFPGGVWNILVNETNAPLIRRLQRDFTPLGKAAKLNRGLITGDKEKFFSDVKTDATPHPLLEGGDVHRYSASPPTHYISLERPITAGGSWDHDVHLAPHKIVLRQIAEQPTASLIREPIPVTGNVFTIRGKDLNEELYLLGIINSRLCAYFWNIMFADFKSSFPQVTIQSLAQLPIKPLAVDGKHSLAKALAKASDQMSEACHRRQRFTPLLQQKIRHEFRTPCALAHYLSPRYADVVREEKLIDDVQRRGFVQGIELAAESDGALVLSARVADARGGEAHPLPVLRLRVAEAALREFLYAGWSAFLAENARRRTWTKGAQSDNIYRLLAHELEPLVVFDGADAVANQRKIAELLEAVGQEAGVRDLAALEREITSTDQEIDRLVYALYELTPAEIALVEGTASEA